MVDTVGIWSLSLIQFTTWSFIVDFVIEQSTVLLVFYGRIYDLQINFEAPLRTKTLCTVNPNTIFLPSIPKISRSGILNIHVTWERHPECGRIFKWQIIMGLSASRNPCSCYKVLCSQSWPDNIYDLLAQLQLSQLALLLHYNYNQAFQQISQHKPQPYLTLYVFSFDSVMYVCDLIHRFTIYHLQWCHLQHDFKSKCVSSQYILREHTIRWCICMVSAFKEL